MTNSLLIYNRVFRVYRINRREDGSYQFLGENLQFMQDIVFTDQILFGIEWGIKMSHNWEGAPGICDHCWTIAHLPFAAG